MQQSSTAPSASPVTHSASRTPSRTASSTVCRPTLPGLAPPPVSGGGGRPARRQAVSRVADGHLHRNEVLLVGRVTAEPSVRELPSGDQLVTWRVSVSRPPAEQRPNQAADPVSCVSFQPAIKEATRDWRIGDLVRVSGSLRRRFWRAPGGSASVFEIEARTVARVAAVPDDGRTAPAPDHQPS
ncbi:single-stranded DNA-binding protein [Marinactinospora rubrisoli]|uniref:Single-stranded DNA-binding protein n=1 Tax=Marinactinospora rubrisoli TaxID=2715399 RepID=A0ABW2KKR2_9ACTN